MATRYSGPYFEIRYGSCNFARGTTKINSWVLEEDGRNFPNRVLRECRAAVHETADREGYGDYGHWHANYLEAKPGSIVLLTAERTVRKVPVAGAGILLRLREGAPTYQISVDLTAAENARYETMPVFVGRADIVEYDQVNEEYGIQLAAGFINNWLDDQEEFDEVFTVARLAEARTGQPTIVHRETEDGVEAVTVDPAPRRRITTRRKL
jgi:hypothetical protein